MSELPYGSVVVPRHRLAPFENSSAGSSPIAIAGLAYIDAASLNVRDLWRNALNALNISTDSSSASALSIHRKPNSLACSLIAAALKDAFPIKISKTIKIIAILDNASEIDKIDSPSLKGALINAQYPSSKTEIEEVVIDVEYLMPGINNSVALACKKATSLLQHNDVACVVVLAASRLSNQNFPQAAVLVIKTLQDCQKSNSRIYALIKNIIFDNNNGEVPTDADDLLAFGYCTNSIAKSNLGIDGLKAVILACLSLYHRIIPAKTGVGLITQQTATSYREVFVNESPRPWIYPKRHPELDLLFPQTELNGKDTHCRKALVTYSGPEKEACLLQLDEASEDYFSPQPSLLESCSTEIFVFQAQTILELQKRLEQIKLGLIHPNSLNLEAGKPNLKDLAYSINRTTFSPDSIKGSIRAAFVVGSIEEFIRKVDLVLDALASNRSKTRVQELNDRGIYLCLNDNATITNGKLAFVLPGLGSAYPHMLSELCFYFPEIRLIFDFVDYLAKESSSRELPSHKIFPQPHRTANGITNVASGVALAEMDAAVVTVLLAEWALFTLFLKLEITPDILVGCSTGEFAALTMSGAADILTSAKLFYGLSTRVANSIPRERLAQLRSIKVKAPYESFENSLEVYDQSIYLSGDLSDEQVILTGDKTVVDQLVRQLEAQGLEVDYLPVAIPYHTALVKGMVENNAELDSLEMKNPEIPSWSCSLADEYPSDPKALKDIATELFIHPIHFKKTIRKLYKDAQVTKFLEVGPKDTLTPIVGEVLGDQEYIAVSANRASGSAIDHLNHTLAHLFSAGVSMNLEYLYSRRNPQHHDFENVVLPNLDGPKIENVQISRVENQPAPRRETTQARDALMVSYLAGLEKFHKGLMETNAIITSAYLTGAKQVGGISSVSPAYQSINALLSKFALLKSARILQKESCLILDLPLTLASHQYLGDHAIGGAVRQHNNTEKVCLLPLTVGLELMAETAWLLCQDLKQNLKPDLKVIELRNIRAYKRVRVATEGCHIQLVAESVESSAASAIVKVRMEKAEEIGQSVDSDPANLFMSCEVQLGTAYLASPDATPAKSLSQDWKVSKFKTMPLYGKHAMFHGPRMQTVSNIDGVTANQIYGQLHKKQANRWFPEMHPDTASDSPCFLIDPLLLDNSTQFVLFHLFENEEKADALLPFIVDTLSIYDGFDSATGSLTVRADLKSVNARGTDADIYISDQTNKLIAKFSSIQSRRIVLSSEWYNFVHNPTESYLSKSAASAVNILCDTDHSVYRLFNQEQLPADEAALSWSADYLLTPKETQLFETLGSAGRRRDWLSGRIAAKESVRLLLSRRENLALSNADIEIAYEESGRPIANVTAFSAIKINISITHKNGYAVATAFLPDSARLGQTVGIDLERITTREADFEQFVLSDSECELLKSALKHNRDQTLSMVWAVKEAAAKALGVGIKGRPKQFDLTACERSDNYFNCQISYVNGKSIHAQALAAIVGEYVFATCFA